MNILFVSNNCIATNIAYILKKEGHNVKLYIKDKEGRRTFDNMVNKVSSWKKELRWVGKDGLIIFDDIGYGKIQDELRNKGYYVFGGSEISDKLEKNREFGQKIFKKYGLKTIPLKEFNNMEDAIFFVKNNNGPWVLKQNDHESKFLTYVGQFDDGRDMISILKNYLNNKNINRRKIALQKRVDGVEIGVGRYFNGKDWVGPIEINLEHTRMFPGDVGPITIEMGTLAWYDDDEKNKLFSEILNKLKPFLKETNFVGDFEINCIVNETGAYPLEATARFGLPIIHLHSEIHNSPWGEFLKALAAGKKYELRWKKGYAVVILLATPPFPYGKDNNRDTLYGVNIYLDKLTKEEKEHVFFEEISMRSSKDAGQLYISDSDGEILYATGVGKTVKEAREKSLAIAKKIVIPKVFYRNDIGLKFEKEDYYKLKKWGYIK